MQISLYEILHDPLVQIDFLYVMTVNYLPIFIIFHEQLHKLSSKDITKHHYVKIRRNIDIQSIVRLQSIFLRLYLIHYYLLLRTKYGIKPGIRK